MKPFGRDFVTNYDLGDPELNERWVEMIPDLHVRCLVARTGWNKGWQAPRCTADLKATGSPAPARQCTEEVRARGTRAGVAEERPRRRGASGGGPRGLQGELIA